jgi:hypothetical protein
MPIDKLFMKITVAVDSQKSSSLEIPSWARTAIMKVPAITDGTLTLEMIDPADITPAKLAADSDTDWCPVYSDEGRTDILGVGQDPAFVNITPYIGGFPQSGHMRVVCSVAQVADMEFVVHFKH